LPLLNLGLHDGSPFLADADRIVTGRTCVIGASGSGKSYLVAVLCEELSRAGLPFLIIDTEGEYHTLKEKYDLLWVGDDEKCDVRLNELRLDELAATAPVSQPIILDLSDSADQFSVLGTLLTALYAEVSRRRLPYLVVLEEADRFVPQAGERLPVLDEIARRGRKRGLGLVICTQRPSIVDKNVLSQCSNQLIGRLVIRNDLQAVSHFFPGQRLPKQLTTLAPGSFYAMGDLAPQPVQITVKARETSHGGSTPLLSSRPPAPLLPYPRSSAPHGIGPSARTRDPAQGGSISADASGPVETVGFASRIKIADVPFLVRRARSYVLFGGREMIVGLQKVLVPIIELAVRSRVGLLKKHFETKYLLVDGRDGRSVEVGDGISFGVGVSEVLGLEQRDIEVLQALEPSGELTVFDLVGRVRLSEDLVRESLKALEDRRLALSYRRGRVKVYRRTAEVPQIKLEPVQAVVEKIDEDGTKEPPRVKDEELRKIIRGLVEGGDVDTTSLLYYPLYRVRLELNGKSRTVWIDARTGRHVESAH
jgi:predicted transcriptional regulator